MCAITVDAKRVGLQLNDVAIHRAHAAFAHHCHRLRDRLIAFSDDGVRFAARLQRAVGSIAPIGEGFRRHR